MVDNAGQIEPAWLLGKMKVGVTAGASAPEVLVKEVVARLEKLGASAVQEASGIAENVVFPIPKDLS